MFTALKTHAWAYPALEVVHIVGIALLLGNLVLLDSWPGQMRTVYGDHDRFEQTYFSTFQARGGYTHTRCVHQHVCMCIVCTPPP